MRKNEHHEVTPALWVGIDGGATRCRASIYDQQYKLLGRGFAGSANPVNGLEQTQKSIIQSISEAIKDAKLDCQFEQLVIGAGLAGLHLPVALHNMQSWQHPFDSIYFTSDIHSAVMGAHDGSDGAVIILGTGFSALGVANDKQFPIGGYGFPINATGSGSWFGLELVKAVLLDYDDIGPKTSMTKAILDREDIIALTTRMNNALPSEFATFAPDVFEHANQGDKLAITIVEEGAAFLETVMQKLLDNGVSRISFVGGVAPHLQQWIKPQLKQYVVNPKSSPEYGALLYAVQEHEKSAAS